MKNKVIGIHGFARSGKDTVADYIIDNDKNVLKYSFANPLKSAVSSLFNIPREDLDGDNREVVLPEWGLSIRQILQRFGTESMREVFGEDFWLKKAQQTVDRIEKQFGIYQHVIADVRFENEADFCRKNGILIHIERPDVDGAVGDIGHASEGGINLNTSDYHINNDGDLEDLYKKVDIIMREIDE